MSKHIADKPRNATDSKRLERYTQIERESGGAHEQTLELQRRGRGERDDARRAQEFLRIERGRSA